MSAALDRDDLFGLEWDFPPGSVVTTQEILDRHELGDRASTVARCDLLLTSVRAYLRSAE